MLYVCLIILEGLHSLQYPRFAEHSKITYFPIVRIVNNVILFCEFKCKKTLQIWVRHKNRRKKLILNTNC